MTQILECKVSVKICDKRVHQRRGTTSDDIHINKKKITIATLEN